MKHVVKFDIRNSFYDSYQAQFCWGTILQVKNFYNRCLVINPCSYLVSHMCKLAQSCWLDEHLSIICSKPTASLGRVVPRPLGLGYQITPADLLEQGGRWIDTKSLAVLLVLCKCIGKLNLVFPMEQLSFPNGQGLDTALIDPGHFRFSIAIRSCLSLEI